MGNNVKDFQHRLDFPKHILHLFRIKTPIVFNNFGVPLAVQKPNESLLYARKCYLSNFSLGVAKHSVFEDMKKVQFLGKEKNFVQTFYYYYYFISSSSTLSYRLLSIYSNCLCIPSSQEPLFACLHYT